MDRIDLPDTIVDFRREEVRRGYKLVMLGASAPTGASTHSPHIWTKAGVLPLPVSPAEADKAGQVDGPLITSLDEDIAAWTRRRVGLARTRGGDTLDA